MEAIQCGTPVLASRVPGNVGMLGPQYGGFFPHDDGQALAGFLHRCRIDQADPDGLLARLAGQCALRASLFAPETERAALHQLIEELLAIPAATTREEPAS
jgi:glycosyltransferase involved in cell wall biosynthesis